MAKKAGKLASRYARALLNAVVNEQGSNVQDGKTPAQTVAAGLQDFAKLWQNEKNLSTSLQNPMFDKNERMSALLEIAKRSGLPDVAVRFLRVCFDRDRIAALPEIAEAFKAEAERSAGILAVQVVTAREVSDEEKKLIEHSLVQQMKGQLEFSWTVSPEILGGIVVRYAGKVLDGSLAGRLERIETKLQATV